MASKVHAVGVIFENERQEILVLRRLHGKPEGETWGLVGGKIDPTETMEAAAAREAQEEIGYTINLSNLRFLKTYHWDRQDLDITFEVFKIQAPSNTIAIDINHSESTEYAWVQPGELYAREDLMIGLYPILEDTYQV